VEALETILARATVPILQLTVDRYGHFIPGTNRAAVDRLAKITTREPSESVSAESNFDDTKTAEAVRK
jgi:hypothetical protein